jgi:hypothetical protein
VEGARGWGPGQGFGGGGVGVIAGGAEGGGWGRLRAGAVTVLRRAAGFGQAQLSAAGQGAAVPPRGAGAAARAAGAAPRRAGGPGARQLHPCAARLQDPPGGCFCFDRLQRLPGGRAAPRAPPPWALLPTCARRDGGGGSSAPARIKARRPELLAGLAGVRLDIEV